MGCNKRCHRLSSSIKINNEDVAVEIFRNNRRCGCLRSLRTTSCWYRMELWWCGRVTEKTREYPRWQRVEGGHSISDVFPKFALINMYEFLSYRQQCCSHFSTIVHIYYWVFRTNKMTNGNIFSKDNNAKDIVYACYVDVIIYRSLNSLT